MGSMSNLCQLLCLISLTLTGCGSTGRVTTVRLVDGKPQPTRYVDYNAYHHYLRAEIATAHGNLFSAEHALRTALSFDPDSPFLRTQLASLLVARGRLSDGRYQIERALQLSAGFPDALMVAAELSARAGDAAAAERYYRHCIRENPQYWPAYGQLAELLEQQSRGAAARELLKRISGLLPGSVAPFESLASSCLRSLDYACARNALQSAYEIAPHADTLFELVHVHRALGQAKTALAKARELYAQRPDLSSAALLLELLRHAEATAEIDSLLETFRRGSVKERLAAAKLALSARQPAWAQKLVKGLDTPLARAIDAVATYGLGQHSLALKQLDQVAVGGNLSATAAVDIARLLAQLSQAQQAATVFLQRLALPHADAPQVQAELAMLQAAAGRHDSALLVLQRARKKRETFLLRFTAAVVLTQSGQGAMARAAAKTLLEGRPNDPLLLNLTGYLLADSKEQLPLAEKLLFTALRYAPLSAHVVDSVGWLRFRQGRHADAERILRYAANLLPSEAEVLEHLGAVREQRGKHQAAIALYRRALSQTQDVTVRARLNRRLQQLRAGDPKKTTEKGS
ncbi:MAG: tetratricopeptide repeat protein [Deltaproteobacteria bacterium]|nr:tetratricopeptide repeat protein [Deltaproteobacteria bacterium]